MDSFSIINNFNNDGIRNIMDIWDDVIQSYNKEIENLKNSLASGGIEDYAHYRQLVGSINGIEWSRQQLTDILKRRQHLDEEDF